MKYIYLSSLMIALSAFFLIGCENAEYKAQSNSLYITDAAGTNNATTVTMDDGADINVVVRLAQKVMEDVEVEIQFFLNYWLNTMQLAVRNMKSCQPICFQRMRQ